MLLLEMLRFSCRGWRCEGSVDHEQASFGARDLKRGVDCLSEFVVEYDKLRRPHVRGMK